MKKILYIIITLGLMSTLVEARWINLSDEQCNRYSGSGDAKGVIRVGADRGCFGGFKRAKKICRRAGGRVPSVRDFQRLASKCNFRLTQIGSKVTPSSQKCLEKYGILYSPILGKFWTRNREPGLNEYMVIVDIVHATFSMGLRNVSRSNVLCVR